MSQLIVPLYPMGKKEIRQKKILDFIEKNGRATVSEITTFFEKKLDRKTIQRDLEILTTQGQLVKEGAGRATEYRAGDIIRLLKHIDVDNYFAIDDRDRTIVEEFDWDIFRLLEQPVFTNKEFETLEKLNNEFIANISKYDSQTLVNKEFERVMIEFSWKSSAIEGNTYSLLNTEALLKNNVKAEGKTEEEAQMILNHKDAFNEVLQNRDEFMTISLANIEHIHSTLTKKLGVMRNIRAHGVGITGTRYKPLDNIHQLRDALELTTQVVNKKTSFFEKAIMSIALLSYIQPFEDGNKRTSRMVSNAILLANNSIPLSYRVVGVEDYKKATILFYEQTNLSYLKELFIFQFEDAVKNYFV